MLEQYETQQYILSFNKQIQALFVECIMHFGGFVPTLGYVLCLIYCKSFPVDYVHTNQTPLIYNSKIVFTSSTVISLTSIRDKKKREKKVDQYLFSPAR